ncbi:probable protein phosphatase 2C 52 [Syzygium oleosum]|uniref:probable protein phosphatase 2C 52 n=1 Tax=Syzygium oleosum TaxID=219896 RepID=UPI0011D2525C|nr:probable protein phosphatase 2C 52 [Syzygium oleosum]XP_030459527.1 probable protein phosphatase 2C 52 [Syzygium oleosum]XP_030459529.1 probable protein phosphatase 2C 52 [Syzygium oleosum]XP_056171152.1 probable protein phosphatase 2C 52 [Syzygium oleosum]XP_056171153.1 probable protein phosphatase 2C 52 [Syzygium oleosum]XP_056171154.1 probable protein phosphatase 2C 52 [Syzygium oleosum]
MGGCVSTSSRSTCSSRSNGETTSPPCMGIGFCWQKRTKRTYSERHVALQHLPTIPNRVFMNGKSRTSCIFTQQGRKGINQDAMVVWEDFMEEDMTFCGVFDGHGPYGHLVARKVRDVLPVKLQSFLHSCNSKQNESGLTCFNGNARKTDAGNCEDDDTAEDKLNSLWRDAFLKSYKAMDKELRSHPHLDCFCSGSTAVTIVKQGLNLFMGYIGDSRAVLGSKDSNDSMVATQLSVDMKPDLPREAERIKRCKGRVFALQDEPEVPRVWLPFDDAPGLAMARAFGDFCLKEYGVISIPEFSHRVLTERDQFIVLASDGVWDVLSNEEVVEIVASAPSRASAARIVVDSAAREWKLKYPTSKMDDCAVVCLFLDGKMDSESDYEEQGFSSATLQSNHSGNALESDDGQRAEPSLQRNFTVRSSEENDNYGKIPVESEGNGEPVAAEDQDWSGLEGVTRVNSLVQLPRFSEERPVL